MSLELIDVLWMSLVFCLAAYWWHSMRIRDTALRHVRKRCEELNVQLLDQSIALRGLALKRGGSGMLRLRRRYSFEFSATGEERYRGYVDMFGLKVSHLHLQPHRMTQAMSDNSPPRPPLH